MKKPVFPTLLLFVSLLPGFQACRPSELKEQVKDVIRSHYKENLLEELQAHYRAPQDSLKRKSAEFLVGQMDELRTGDTRAEDLGSVEADYLIRNIDLAFQTAGERLRTGRLRFDDFCEYVLPYRMASEPLTDWRGQGLSRYATLLTTYENSEKRNVDISDSVNNDIRRDFKYGTATKPAQLLAWEELMKQKTGNCWAMTMLVNYPLRSLGIPVTTDFVSRWSNNNGVGHAWNALQTGPGRWIPFMGCEIDVTDPLSFDPFGIYHEQRLPAKIYRSTFSRNPEALVRQVEDHALIPDDLTFERYIDVTDQYLPTSTVAVPLPGTGQPEIAYLATFSSGSWEPVYWAKPAGNRLTFPKMARSILYLPCTYQRDKGVSPIGNPLYVEKETGKTVTLKADRTRRGTITVETLQSKGMEEIAVFSLGREFIPFIQTMDSICLDQKRSRPLDHRRYRLFYWDNGWQAAGEAVKRPDRPLRFDNVPSGTVYRLLPDDPKQKERLFTYSDHRQLWW
ncbi:transglutaminase-like domain-containing protein [Larkinella soli]|uniref:transglutaminase-like domain-containing protein n=1 Tax=Larkinella soli TaxID=1770527 RepID=UPI000FFC571D|nr:transglutaminase domain-containing protein [Larkinella soli]